MLLLGIVILPFDNFRRHFVPPIKLNFRGGNYMKSEPIILEWIEKGKKHRTEINRKEMFDLMESIKRLFMMITRFHLFL